MTVGKFFGKVLRGNVGEHLLTNKKLDFCQIDEPTHTHVRTYQKHTTDHPTNKSIELAELCRS